MLKRYAIIILLSMLPLMLTGCSKALSGLYSMYLTVEYREAAEKGDIITYIMENESTISHAVYSGDYSGLVYQGTIEEYDNIMLFAHRGIIDTVCITENVVYFFCGGGGLASPALSPNFYLSSSGAAGTLRNFGFLWKKPGFDIDIHTEHVCGDFYYYEINK